MVSKTNWDCSILYRKPPCIGLTECTRGKTTMKNYTLNKILIFKDYLIENLKILREKNGFLKLFCVLF